MTKPTAGMQDISDLNELDPDSLLADARAEAGLADYGDMSFVQPLTQLMKAVVTDARLTPMGRLGTRARVLQCLVNRLRLQQDLSRHPDILDEEVTHPIVIVGLPRTGTSKLQRMLSCDPDVQTTPLWRLLNPAPPPGWQRGDSEAARIALAEAHVAGLGQRPDFIAAHPMAPMDPDEDVFMMDMAFDGILPLVQYRVPSFHDWVRDRSRGPFYAFEKILLQYLQWQDGGARGRPWVLKSQTHLGGLSALVDTFPGVTLVHCHRDIGTALASTLLTAEGLRGLLSDDVDLADLGADFLRIYTNEMNKYLRQRDELGSRASIVDVRYQDIVENPMSVIRAIYDAHGRTLTPEAEGAMLAWSEEHPHVRAGKISYDLGRYQLTKAEVEAAFSEYHHRFAASF